MPYLIFNLYDGIPTQRHKIILTHIRKRADSLLGITPEAFSMFISTDSLAWKHLSICALKIHTVAPYSNLSPEIQSLPEGLLPRATTADSQKGETLLAKGKLKWTKWKESRQIKKWKSSGALKEEDALVTKRGDIDLRVVAWEVALKDVKEAESRDLEFGERMKKWRDIALGRGQTPNDMSYHPFASMWIPM